MICTPFTVFIYSSFKRRADQCGDTYQCRRQKGKSVVLSAIERGVREFLFRVYIALLKDVRPIKSIITLHHFPPNLCFLTSYWVVNVLNKIELCTILSVYPGKLYANIEAVSCFVSF